MHTIHDSPYADQTNVQQRLSHEVTASEGYAYSVEMLGPARSNRRLVEHVRAWHANGCAAMGSSPTFKHERPSFLLPSGCGLTWH